MEKRHLLILTIVLFLSAGTLLAVNSLYKNKIGNVAKAQGSTGPILDQACATGTSNSSANADQTFQPVLKQVEHISIFINKGTGTGNFSVTLIDTNAPEPQIATWSAQTSSGTGWKDLSLVTTTTLDVSHTYRIDFTQSGGTYRWNWCTSSYSRGFGTDTGTPCDCDFMFRTWAPQDTAAPTFFPLPPPTKKLGIIENTTGVTPPVDVYYGWRIAFAVTDNIFPKNYVYLIIVKDGDTTNTPIKTFLNWIELDSLEHSYDWDAKDDQGRFVLPGKYRFALMARDGVPLNPPGCTPASNCTDSPNVSSFIYSDVISEP